MQYRRFGRTNLQMPVFSCGGMRYQQSWQDLPYDQVEAANQANVKATIEAALDHGITHIETARAYGTSEVQLGHVLQGIDRDRYIFQTKGVPSANADSFTATIEQSLSLLQLDYVDLFSIHGINNAETLDWTMRPNGCLDAARRLQDQGKIRHIGFSTHGPTDVIVEAIETGAFDYLNLHWYYINQTNWAAIEAATGQDMGVFIISPSDKGGHLYAPPPKLAKLCEPLSPMVFNDLFCLSHPQVHTLSLGAAKPSDFDEHLKALPLLDQAAEVVAPIVATLEQAAIAVLGETWFRTWTVGLPTHSQTPENINIPMILWLYNLVKFYDMVDYAKARYNLLGNASHWFPGCRADGVESIDLQACLAQSPHRQSIPDLLAKTHQLLAGDTVARLSQD
jgi:uncharacterized protein